MKKILVDMTASIIHHGHVRLIKKASKFGKVYVALTTDKEVKKYKGYYPELNYNQRKEIISEFKSVFKVIPSKWIISQKFLDKNSINLIVSGSDYNSRKFKTKSINFSRTKAISSSLIRNKISSTMK